MRSFKKFFALLVATTALVSVLAFAPPLPPMGDAVRLLKTTKLSLDATTHTKQEVLDISEGVGSGSYGTVHVGYLANDSLGNAKPLICKRAWTRAELHNTTNPKEREERCKYYFGVEKHCFEKMMDHPSPFLPRYLGTFRDADEQHEWMTFELISYEDDESKPAPTLSDVMKMDWKDQHDGSEQHHHLFMIQEALGMERSSSFSDTLDRLLYSMLEALCYIHSQQGIVHRDIKPQNLLCDAKSHSLVLIDFGSAADVDPVKKGIFGSKRIGFENRVAVSPIYSAPEVFIEPKRNPFAFDVFSSALIFCQLLFNLLDIRTDAGFHQQLEAAQWDLDTWLSRELSATVRPTGLEDALDHLAQRPGLWKLLGYMLQKDPEDRIGSASALKEFKRILHDETTQHDDGPFLESVIALMESCDIGEISTLDYLASDESLRPRPLHYVATFQRSEPLGLILAESDQGLEAGNEEERAKWTEAVSSATPGSVFVQGVVESSQAEDIGIFEVGDQLQGVGELPLARGGGFEGAVQMLQNQPKSAKSVKLRFNRPSARTSGSIADKEDGSGKEASQLVTIVDEGAWSARGRRKAQEDRFLLHDVELLNDGMVVLLAAVFDGHAGTAASESASQLMPDLFAEQLQSGVVTKRQALELAWEATCDTYRTGCADGECVADYDAMEGILLANTGSTGVVAGTTATMVAVQGDGITFLNCGDSRGLMISSDGSNTFATKDHTPQEEMGRLEKGRKERGLDYSIPECSLSRWFIQVGDMQYAVCRSLEGPFATSKGIVSDPDVTTVRGEPGGIVMLGSDGIFEVMDNELIGKETTKMRKAGISAADAAKRLCSLAIEKGTSDNVSAIVIYLE